MIIKEMTIVNSRGGSLTFGEHFKLVDDFEMSALEADVNYSDSTSDGAVYQNTVMAKREFDIPFFIHNTSGSDIGEWIETRRQEAYTVFNPKLNPFTIYFTTSGGQNLYINANLERAPAFGREFENNNRLWLRAGISFSCSDPYFYDTFETSAFFGNWISQFSFPLELSTDGIEMGVYSESLTTNVVNGGQTDTGMTIRFKSRNRVVNPSLTDVYTYDILKMNMTLEQGDEVYVNTRVGSKSATLLKNNLSIDVFNKIDMNSTFFQLTPGNNTYRFDAEEGIEYLEIEIFFNTPYLGV